MRKITEEDVFLHNGCIILEACYLNRKGMEWDDCLMAANEGFLYAIRSYRKEISDFPTYARHCIYEQIKSEKRERNRIQRIESRLSLDCAIVNGRNTESIGSAFYHAHGDFINSILLNDSLENLGGSLKIIARMRTQGYSSDEIMEKRKISRDQFERSIENIRESLSIYDR